MVRAFYKKVKKLSVSERAYIAGIIDGEGSVTLTIKQKGGTRHLAITISNTDLLLLKYILRVIGAGKLTSKRTYKNHHSPSYIYAIHSRQALEVLRQILPYLRTYKKQRANYAMSHYITVTPRNGKYNKLLHDKKQKFVKNFFAIAPFTTKAII